MPVFQGQNLCVSDLRMIKLIKALLLELIKVLLLECVNT